MGRRITRKQLRQQDEFVSSVDTAMHWLGGRWQPLAAGVGVIAVLVLLWAGIGWWRSSRSEESSYLLAQAVKAMGDQGAGKAADLEVARAKLQEVVDRFGSSADADAARVYLARIAAQKGDTQTARDMLTKVADHNRGNAVGALAQLDLVHLRVASGQSAEVVKELQAVVAGSGTGLPRDAALHELAAICVKEQQPEQAKQYLEQLIKEFPESPYLSSARRELDELS